MYNHDLVWHLSPHLKEATLKYKRFEELPVWRDAIELAVQVYDFTSKPPFRRRYSLRNQLERAAVSISNNAAEGFERGTTQELLTFLYISKGSAAETRSVLCLCQRLSGFEDSKSEILNLKSRAESISRQLNGWCNSLQNSDIRGPRYLTQAGRQKSKAAREREEFLKELEEIKNRHLSGSGG